MRRLSFSTISQINTSLFYISKNILCYFLSHRLLSHKCFLYWNPPHASDWTIYMLNSLAVWIMWCIHCTYIKWWRKTAEDCSDTLYMLWCRDVTVEVRTPPRGQTVYLRWRIKMKKKTQFFYTKCYTSLSSLLFTIFCEPLSASEWVRSLFDELLAAHWLVQDVTRGHA